MKVKRFNENNEFPNETILDILEKLESIQRNIDVENDVVEEMLIMIEPHVTSGDDNESVDKAFVFIKTIQDKLKESVDFINKASAELKNIKS